MNPKKRPAVTGAKEDIMNDERDVNPVAESHQDVLSPEGIDKGIDKGIAMLAEPQFSPEELEEVFARLAKLDPCQYEQVRNEEAFGIKHRVSTLDGEVKKRRPKAEGEHSNLQGDAVSFPKIEPWGEPVKLGEVLKMIADEFRGYIAMTQAQADAAALWVVHSHCFDAFQMTPRLVISSPEKGCGKTTMRDLVALFVPRPLLTENMTPAVLFRLVQKHHPTILADEFDRWLKYNEELTGLINSGHSKNGRVYRCIGDNHDVHGFEVFSPAVLCGIGNLPGTIQDRSIVIRLERAKKDELAKRFDSRKTATEEELCRKIARWIQGNRSKIEQAEDPELPGGAVNRLADNWRPLFTLAELAGGEWPQRACDSFEKLSESEKAASEGTGIRLLNDIRTISKEEKGGRIFTDNLIAKLLSMNEWWGEAKRGKPISPAWLAHKLRPFGLSPRTIRIDRYQNKGYEFKDFEDAFERYLPSIEGESIRPIVPDPINTGQDDGSETSQERPKDVPSPSHTTSKELEESPPVPDGTRPSDSVGRLQKGSLASKDAAWDGGTVQSGGAKGRNESSDFLLQLAADTEKSGYNPIVLLRP